jgi:hypothetical protein
MSNMAKWAVLDRQLSPRHRPSNPLITPLLHHHKLQNITSNLLYLHQSAVSNQSDRGILQIAQWLMAEEIFNCIQRCIDDKCLYVNGAEFFKLLQDLGTNVTEKQRAEIDAKLFDGICRITNEIETFIGQLSAVQFTVLESSRVLFSTPLDNIVRCKMCFFLSTMHCTLMP